MKIPVTTADAVWANVRSYAIENYTNGYRIYIGGRWGKKVAQGRYLEQVFTDKEQVLSIVEKQFCFSVNREIQENVLQIPLQESVLKTYRHSFLQTTFLTEKKKI